MTAQHPKIFYTATGVGLFCCFCYLLAPDLVQAAALPVAVLLILGAGIPHGAADFAIFKQLNTKNWSNLRFFGLYLSLSAVYALLWWWQPAIALGIFLILSAYHFGQSNWQAILDEQNWLIKSITYLLWGTLVVFAPLLFHFAETSVIIEQIIAHKLPDFTIAQQVSSLYVLVMLNVVWMAILLPLTNTSVKQIGMEYLNISILLLLFYTLPLLLAFALYFVLWHSFSSIQDQIWFFKEMQQGFNLKNYAAIALPFTLMAIFGLGAWYALYTFTGVQELNIGLLFSFIAIITLPHTIVMEGLYQQFNGINIKK